ncbi:hypothetical protein RQP46_008192 [Phenoliferia psychrophenolica]
MEEAGIIFMVVTALLMPSTLVVWYFWCGEAPDFKEWGTGQFGMLYSWVPLTVAIGRWAGELMDATWVAFLWVVVSVWPVGYARMAVCHRLETQPWKRPDRPTAHAAFHATVALLYHFTCTLWNPTILYPTIWGFSNFKKLDHPLIQASVYGSLVVGFILGAFDITAQELAMLPITLLNGLLDRGRRMEEEKAERDLEKRAGGIYAKQK